MTLDTQQQMLIEQRVTNDAKSPVVAYLLAIFLGGFGAHRFYLGRTGSGAAILILWILGWLTLAFVVGAFLLLIVGVWVLVDLFLIPGMVERDRVRLRSTLREDLMAVTGARPAVTRDAGPAALPQP
ncbi:TM2 domain-containing protein [Paracoccus luteus]|uniref:TM2 domain-containing protein n=1 Tax=Paracoccus luteus TaxID=2508543 RepID=UPI00106FB292|nr:TM2 domain-containing protein [Paracoccus luteus]